MSSRGTVLSDGWSRLWVAKRWIVWLFVFNLALSWVAGLGLNARLGSILNASLQSDSIVHGFDIDTALEALNRPEVAFSSQTPLLFISALIFLLLQIFLGGGIVHEYLAGTREDRGTFYAACGENFWKFIRIALIFVLFVAIIGTALHALRTFLGNAAEDASNQRLVSLLLLLIPAAEALILLWIRMWFDLAQSHTVATGVRAVRSTIAHAFKTSREAGSLYRAYFLLGLLQLITALLGAWICWVFISSAHTFLSFILLQCVFFLTLALRWWQRAAAADWYTERVAPLLVTPEPLIFPAQPYAAEPIVPEVPPEYPPSSPDLPEEV